MPTFNSRRQAEEIVDAVFFPGPKPRNKADRIGKIFGEATREKYIIALKVTADWAKATYHLRLKQLTPDQIQEYLDQRTTKVGPRQINQDYLAVCLIPGVERDDLTKPRSLVGFGDKATEPRAHTTDEKQRVFNEMDEDTRVSATIADAQGLRAGELYTIRCLKEVMQSSDPKDQEIVDKLGRREWDEDRFHGQKGTPYLVVGKGGLPRVRVFSRQLARLVESRRLDEPREVYDRTRIPIMQHYDLVGGLEFSRAWTEASHRALGESLGAHSLRHGYAMDRMEYHLRRGLDYDQADALVAQELGHFDPYSTREYLRGRAA